MRLPPLNALRAFEAAARHGGFIGAAKELHVTRGAISRHVKGLEADLGVLLFRRQAQGVHLTAAGRRLQPVLTEAFGGIAREVETIRADAGDLRVLCPPATSIRWLIPRLDDFHRLHPEIRVRLTTDFHRGVGYDPADYDLGFSVAHWPNRAKDIEVMNLFPVYLTPACAPGFLAGGRPLREVDDLADAVLLHETPLRKDWAAWLEAFGTGRVDARSGNDFPNLDLAARAAVLGAGVVMADLVLNREEFEAGLLVKPFPEMVCESPLGWVCLLGARDSWQEPKVEAFRTWAARAAAEEVARFAA